MKELAEILQAAKLTNQSLDRLNKLLFWTNVINAVTILVMVLILVWRPV